MLSEIRRNCFENHTEPDNPPYLELTELNCSSGIMGTKYQAYVSFVGDMGISLEEIGDYLTGLKLDYKKHNGLIGYSCEIEEANETTPRTLHVYERYVSDYKLSFFGWLWVQLKLTELSLREHTQLDDMAMKAVLPRTCFRETDIVILKNFIASKYPEMQFSLMKTMITQLGALPPEPYYEQELTTF